MSCRLATAAEFCVSGCLYLHQLSCICVLVLHAVCCSHGGCFAVFFLCLSVLPWSLCLFRSSVLHTHNTTHGRYLGGNVCSSCPSGHGSTCSSGFVLRACAAYRQVCAVAIGCPRSYASCLLPQQVLCSYLPGAAQDCPPQCPAQPICDPLRYECWVLVL
jgi:hypothetical protein